MEQTHTCIRSKSASVALSALLVEKSETDVVPNFCNSFVVVLWYNVPGIISPWSNAHDRFNHISGRVGMIWVLSPFENKL